MIVIPKEFLPFSLNHLVVNTDVTMTLTEHRGRYTIAFYSHGETPTVIEMADYLNIINPINFGLSQGEDVFVSFGEDSLYIVTGYSFTRELAREKYKDEFINEKMSTDFYSNIDGKMNDVITYEYTMLVVRSPEDNALEKEVGTLLNIIEERGGYRGNMDKLIYSELSYLPLGEKHVYSEVTYKRIEDFSEEHNERFVGETETFCAKLTEEEKNALNVAINYLMHNNNHCFGVSVDGEMYDVKLDTKGKMFLEIYKERL